jgi:hypothetical protein
MHALTEMVRQLGTNTEKKTGLVLANGGWLSYQHVVCLPSNSRPKALGPYPERNPLLPLTVDWQIPQIPQICGDGEADGNAVIETHTVDFARKGKQERGHIVGRLKFNGHRFIANHGDKRTLLELSNVLREQVGRWGRVMKDNGTVGRNLFTFDVGVKL